MLSRLGACHFGACSICRIYPPVNPTPGYVLPWCPKVQYQSLLPMATGAGWYAGIWFGFHAAFVKFDCLSTQTQALPAGAVFRCSTTARCNDDDDGPSAARTANSRSCMTDVYATALQFFKRSVQTNAFAAALKRVKARWGGRTWNTEIPWA